MTAGYIASDEAPTREAVDRMPGLVLLEFGTEWCGFCRAAAPQVAALLRDNPAVRHVKVEDGPGLPLGRSFRVRLWPTFVLLRDGAVVRQVVRPTGAELKEAFGALVGG